MPKGNDCPKCLEKINALIANEQSKFTEADREWLLTQDEATLDKLAPVIVEKEKVVEKAIEVNKLSAEDQADLAWARSARRQKRDKLIETIQVNTKDVWKPEELAAMSDSILEKVANSVKKEEIVDYSLNGTGFNANVSATEDIALYPAGVEDEPKK